MKDLVIVGGAAGMDVVYHHLKRAHPDLKVAVLDERATEETITVCGDVLPLITDWDFSRARRYFNLGDAAFKQFMPLFTYPKVKKILVDKATEHGLKPAPSYIHPTTEIIGPYEIGVGCFIGKGCDIAPEAKIGDFVSAGNAVIGHHVTVGNLCTVGTNTALLGFCTLGEGVQVSPGAIVRTGVTIAPWVVIGIQAAVVSDVPEEGVTIGGVPARPLPKKEA